MVRNLVVAVLVTVLWVSVVWGADIQEAHVFYVQEYQDGVALDGFWFGAYIEGTGIETAGIEWSGVGGEGYCHIFEPWGPQRWGFESISYTSLDALLLDFPVTDSWNIAWNEGLAGEDDIDITPNITFPSGMVTIDYPADMADDVELDPTYEWTNNSNANALTANVFEIIDFDDEAIYRGR